MGHTGIAQKAPRRSVVRRLFERPQDNLVPHLPTGLCSKFARPRAGPLWAALLASLPDRLAGAGEAIFWPFAGYGFDDFIAHSNFLTPLALSLGQQLVGGIEAYF